MDGILVLQEHLVHLDLQLVGLEVDRADQTDRKLGAGAEGVVDVLPGVDLGGILAADLILRGAKDGAGNVGHPGEPLLLQAADVLLVEEGKPGHHDDVAAGDIAAHVAVTLHEDHLLTAGPGRGNGGRVTGSAAAYHQNVTFGVDRDLALAFQNRFVHYLNSFSSGLGL